MRAKLGTWVLVFVLAGYTAVHWIYVLGRGAFTVEQLSYNLGALAVICMATAIFLSTRPRFVEDYFGGLDKMYRVHKWLGIASVLLLVAHFVTSVAGGDDDAPRQVAQGLEALSEDADDEEGGEGTEVIGMFGMLGILLLNVLTLNRKIAYHRWIKTHVLMGVFFLLVTLHVWLAFKDGQVFDMDAAPAVMIWVALAVGCISLVYKYGFSRFRRRHRFTLSQVNAMPRATELVLTPASSGIAFEPGQFAFVRIQQKGFGEWHPFTICSDARVQELRFTLKVLGDYTRRVRESLTCGATVVVDGPYGRFCPLRDARPQVWIAAGVGITPFLSVLRSMSKTPASGVDLFYCVRDRDSALYLQELTVLAQDVDAVKLHLLVSKEGQRLSPELLAQRLVAPLAERSFYYCGPRALLEVLRTGLAKKGVSSSQIHFEEFEIR